MATEGVLPSRLIWFTALIYGKPPDLFGQDDWYWRALCLPPFDYADADDHSSDDADPYPDADYTDGASDDESPHPCDVSAFTVVGDSQIWVSTVGAGTYSFDTASRKWSKVGEWALPFRGRAVYVPEHSLWFGFSDEGYQLCSTDLAPLTPPVPHKVWWQDPRPPVEQVEALWLRATHLLPLGSGKLCVARLFKETQEEYGYETSAVVTGVEVRRSAGVGDLEMVKHRSRHYSFGKSVDVRLL